MTRSGAALAAAAVLVTVTPEGRAGAATPRAWAPVSASPVPANETRLDAFGQAALSRCGVAEAGLGQVAEELLAIKIAGGHLPDPDAIAFAQRAAGEPHPWARVWSASTKGASGDGLLAKLGDWLPQGRTLSRCGAASGVAPNGERFLVVVSVDALADLAPLPTRARVGQWITVEAHLRVPAKNARVMILGPSGVPRPLLASVDRSTVRARFAPDRAGAFTVQVVADVAGGPRPVLEANVFAGVEPSAELSSDPAPGEDAATGAVDDSEALARMLFAARESVTQHALGRDRRLDEVALAHCARMSRAQALAHDVGDGDPEARLDAVGLETRLTGENVAHAATVVQAHRALWASPSHRMNMVRSDYQRVGIGVVHGEGGDVWVTELFEGQ